MRKFLPIVISALLLLTIPGTIRAQTLPTASSSGEIEVKARVGQFSLTIDGYQSPNASVLLQTKSAIFLDSTTTDNEGYFSFPLVPTTEDLPGFCFQAIDFKRVGLSESCIDIEEKITENKTYNDIFLPPTIGLSKKIIAAGEDALIYGYSMPDAEVTLQFEDETVKLKTDEAGFYEYKFDNVPAGIYSFSARAVLGESTSLEPRNKAVLEAVTLQELFRSNLEDIGKEAEKRFPGILILAPLILIFLALLLTYLIKTKPKWLSAAFDKFKHKYPMHHDYFLFEQ